MSLLLSEELPLNQSVPKEYNLKVTNESTVNTFIFTEKDLPGYNNRAKGQGRQARSGASMPFSQVAPRLFPDHKKQDLSGIEKTKRYQPYFRKAIPSKVFSGIFTGNCLLMIVTRENRYCWRGRNRDQLSSS